MRNIRVCQRSCPQNRAVLSADKKEVLYQCSRDMDCDGVRLGPHSFDSVVRLELPLDCDREFDHAVLGEGTILDAVSAINYGATPKFTKRFMIACADCRCFMSEYSEEGDEQLLRCDLDKKPTSLSVPDRRIYDLAISFLRRPLPEGCLKRQELEELSSRFEESPAN